VHVWGRGRGYRAKATGCEVLQVRFKYYFYSLESFHVMYSGDTHHFTTPASELAFSTAGSSPRMSTNSSKSLPDHASCGKVAKVKRYGTVNAEYPY